MCQYTATEMRSNNRIASCGFNTSRCRTRQTRSENSQAQNEWRTSPRVEASSVRVRYGKAKKGRSAPKTRATTTTIPAPAHTPRAMGKYPSHARTTEHSECPCPSFTRGRVAQCADGTLVCDEAGGATPAWPGRGRTRAGKGGKVEWLTAASRVVIQCCSFYKIVQSVSSARAYCRNHRVSPLDSGHV